MTVTLLKDLKWGERVLVKATLVRGSGKGSSRNQGSRFWVREPLDKPILAIFLKRTGLWDGTADTDGEGNREFYPEKYHYGAYVVLEGRSFTNKVFLADIERVKE